ncbi:AAA family ATPase [Nocardioides sp.]|uniref:AAA family ATPase n=1 Tax=Nocardioides sp. TaxID=35761 RepID=UPI002C8B4053|nr:AAA family ATPase [Nocardioides sp.]HSX67223.1 AAA family ATPase [Nocardioides sp.]
MTAEPWWTREPPDSDGASHAQTPPPVVDSGEPNGEPEPDSVYRRLAGWKPGGAFILDGEATPTALWGTGDDVLLADGESLIIAGSQGLGKSTLAQQVALGRCGLPGYEDLIGYPITPGNQRTLYLAMDRPNQIKRSMRRMVDEEHRAHLDEMLAIWSGPPPYDLAKHPTTLTEMCQAYEADTVIVDSLKDAALGLTDDEVGAGWNRARQKAIAAGVQVIELHHNRKALNGAKAATPTLDDIYGSTWITSGSGSVLLLTGTTGDPLVTLHHLKQPADTIGPLRLLHDHSAGRTAIFHSVDLLKLAAASPAGLTARDAAAALFETEEPTDAQREKARRRLEKHHKDGHMHRKDGDQKANIPTRYFRTRRTGE